MRPRGKLLVNAGLLEGNLDGVWGNAGHCTGDASTIHGDLTRLRGNLSALDGIVYPELRGDVSRLRGDITGLYGTIPDLQNEYTFLGLGGDVSTLDAIDDLLGVDATLDRTVEEWVLFFLAAYFLREGEEEYKPQAFQDRVVFHGLERKLLELAPKIRKQEGVEIPESLLTSLPH